MNVFYVPCPDQKIAEDISRNLIQKKLVACTNIVTSMKSMYMWEGELESSNEVILLLLKTSNVSKDKIEDEVKKHHPYKIPCIMQLQVASINSDYSSWVDSCINSK